MRILVLLVTVALLGLAPAPAGADSSPDLASATAGTQPRDVPAVAAAEARNAFSAGLLLEGERQLDDNAHRDGLAVLGPASAVNVLG